MTKALLGENIFSHHCSTSASSFWNISLLFFSPFKSNCFFGYCWM